MPTMTTYRLPVSELRERRGFTPNVAYHAAHAPPEPANSDEMAKADPVTDAFARGKAEGRAAAMAEMAAQRAEDDAGARETAEMTLSAFDGLDRRFEIPHYKTVDAYDAEVARQVIDAGEDAPRSAARTASRACRRGGATAIARATLRRRSSATRSR